MELNKKIFKGFAPLLIAVLLVFVGCDKSERKPSRIYVPPAYPSEFATVPCYSVFSRLGEYLFKKRMTLEVKSGFISSWPMISTYDSTSAKMYKSAQGYTVVSFANLSSPLDSMKLYFRYMDWTKNLEYQFQSQNPLISGTPLNFNQCYGEGYGEFVRVNYGLYPLGFKITSGSVFLRKDPATGKKEIVLCSCGGMAEDQGFEYGATFTGRFTLPN
jgi:hypothetical protein